jgi:collagen type VII alpha
MSRRLALPVVIALVAAASMSALLGGSSAAASLNVSGTWDTVYHCSVGCSGEDFPDVMTFTQAEGSTTVTGTDQASATLAGKLSGSTLTFKLTEGSYTANYTVTIAASGDSWSGKVTDSNGTSGTDTATKAGAPAGAPTGPPVLGKSGSAKVVSGKVLIEAPGSDTFSPLTSTSKIAMGSTINATNGNVAITVANSGKGTETADFYDGEFELTQAHSGFATEKLVGGNFTAACSASGTTGPSGPTGPSGSSGPTGTSGSSGASGSTQAATALAVAASASTKTKVVRQLWGHDTHGKFTTSGRAGSATVLGTIWLTEDLCEGTLFKAVKDSITVTEFAHPSQKHVIAQGHSFLVLLRGS